MYVETREGFNVPPSGAYFLFISVVLLPRYLEVRLSLDIEDGVDITGF